MSDPLVITVSHTLSREETLRRIQPALSTAAESFPVLTVEEEVWSGDRLDFRVRALGQGAVGNVHVGEDHVRLEVSLPWLLRKFGGALQKTIACEGGYCSRRNRPSDIAEQSVTSLTGGRPCNAPGSSGAGDGPCDAS